MPAVLSIRPASAPGFAPSIALDLTNLSPLELRQTSEGWYAVIRAGRYSHRLWLNDLPVRGTPQAIELPLDEAFQLRSQAAYSLWRTLNGRPVRSPPQQLTPQRRRRLSLMLRALDGHVESQSYRAVAEGLFGKGRIPARGWKTCDLRSRIIRLVKQGLALMRGGYRRLLRPKRTDDQAR